MAKKGGKFNIENMSEEQLIAFTKKKKECDAKAQSIVLELLESSSISATNFLKSLPYINQSHYSDVTVERALIKICGYPLCINKLPDKVLGQTYKICTSTNTVYDITDRKHFCSNQCYTASTYIKDQLLTSPLWFRQEKHIPEFKLLSVDVKNVPGERVNISITEKIAKNHTNDFASVFDFTEASLSEIEEKEKNTTTEDISNASTSSVNSSIPNSSTVDSINDISNKNLHEIKQSSDNPTTEQQKPDEHKAEKTHESKAKLSNNKEKSDYKILGDVFERKVPKEDPIITAGRDLHKRLNKTPTVERKKEAKEMSCGGKYSPAVLHIEKSFGEWICFDTLFFIYGEKKLRDLAFDKSDKIKQYISRMMEEMSTDLRCLNEYEKLCKKLNLLELEDRKYDLDVADRKEAVKQLPNYEMLKEDGEGLKIKVASFYKGKMDIPAKEDSLSSEKEEDDAVTNLPLTERTSQHIMRRRIFLKGLDKVLPDMLNALCVPAREISGDIRQLVSTFNFQPHNVIFKNVQWNLIAIIIIKLLSIKNQRLSEQLNETTSNKHLQLLMLSYNLDNEYLNRLVSWLTDLERILI